MDRFFFIKKTSGPRCYIFQIRSSHHHSMDQGDSEEATQAQGLRPLHLWTSGVQCSNVGWFLTLFSGASLFENNGAFKSRLANTVTPGVWIFCFFFRTHPPPSQHQLGSPNGVEDSKPPRLSHLNGCVLRRLAIAIAMVLLGFTGDASASRD